MDFSRFGNDVFELPNLVLVDCNIISCLKDVSASYISYNLITLNVIALNVNINRRCWGMFCR